MLKPQFPEDRLVAVRVLMERAPVYRAISAKAGLIVGLLSLGTAVFIYLNQERQIDLGRTIHGRQFATVWINELVASAVGTIFLLWVGARRNGRPLFSAQFQLVANQIAPYLFIPAVFTAWFVGTGYLGGQELNLVVIWIAFYGLILLSTSVFAPRSIVLLGWAFLLTSVAVPLAIDTLENRFSFDIPNFLMGVTFGLYHLMYAALNWPRRSATNYEPPANGSFDNGSATAPK